MRYAILTAVSTKSQASPEKVSLHEQEARCRAHCNAKGWHETLPPFIIPGHPRTGYVNLRDAERDMPPLQAALDAAQSGAYDVLAIYDFTRLRDLMTMIFDTLVGYRVQLYPITQAIEPVPPSEYDATVADAVMFLLAGSSMASRAEINALRKRRKLGMPARVKRGLAPARVPYGYTKPAHDRQAVPQPLPEIAAALVHAKDMFLRGASTPQIAEYLTAHHVPTARGKETWHPDSLRYILTNPYYAGLITYGTRRRQLDYRTRTLSVVKNDPAEVITAPGLHPPLWTEAEHQRILDEFASRGKAYTGRRASRFSRLLYCPCGSLLWVGYSTWKGHPPSDSNRVFYCSSTRIRTHRPGHTYAWERDIIDSIADKIVTTLQDLDNLQLPAPTNQLPTLQTAITNLLARKENLTDALELGSLLPATYAQRVARLDVRLRDYRGQIADLQAQRARTDSRLSALTELAETLAAVPDYITAAPPQRVNAALRRILNKITVHPDGDIDLDFS